MAVILSVSISKEQQSFLEEQGLSPSELIQGAIEQQMSFSRVSAKVLKDREERITILQKKITQMGTFINKEGLEEKYEKENAIF